MLIETNKHKLDILIKSLLENIKISYNDFFKPIRIVFPSSKIEQFFKSYWLRNKKEVLMNIKFERMDDVLLSLFDIDKKHSLLSSNSYLLFILLAILNDTFIKNNFDKTIKEYIFLNHVDDKDGYDSLRLYSFVKQIAGLFVSYDKNLTILSGWQKDLYIKTINLARNKGFISLRYILEFTPYKLKKQDELYFFGFNNFSNLSEIEQKILKEYSQIGEVNFYSIIKDENYLNDNIYLFSAPNKLREIEYIHSEISKKILEDKDIKFTDFLVLGKDIASYENEIKRVFNQDDNLYPSLPYVIKGNKNSPNDINLAISLLFEIALKGFYTRLDFFKLVNLDQIKNVRNIKEEDINTWMDIVSQTYVFRQRKDNDDWDYIKKRLLLSKFSNINLEDAKIILSEKEYLPYDSIALNDESMSKFIACIVDLNNFIKLVNDIKYLNTENIFLIRDELDKWCLSSDNDKNRIYKKVYTAIYNLFSLGLAHNLLDISFLKTYLLDISNKNSHSRGESFMSGITFQEFDKDEIYLSKYVFFLGLNSTSLPTTTYKSEIDLNIKEDDSSFKEEEAFLKQYQNATERFYISYISLDLINNEPLYKSSFILNLENKIKEDIVKQNPTLSNDEINNLINKKLHVEEILLDENRNWSNLFTYRSFKNKEHFQNLYSNNQNSKTNKKEEIAYPKNMSYSLLVNFLKEPFKATYERLCSVSEDVFEEIKNEFEPYDISKLEASIIRKEVTKELIRLGDIDKYIEAKNIVINDYISNKKSPINDPLYLDSLIEHKKADIENVFDFYKDNFTNPNLVSRNIPNVTLDFGLFNVAIKGNQDILAYHDDKTYSYIELKHFSKNITSEYMRLYILSLMDIASIKDSNDQITVDLYRSASSKATYTLSPEGARLLLKSIIVKMHDYENIKFAPCDFSDKLIDQTESFEKFTNHFKTFSLTKETLWTYFDDKKAINLEKIGYDPYTFNKDDLKKEVEKMKKYIIFETVPVNNGGNE